MLEEKPSKRVIVFSTLDRPFAVLLNLDFVVDRELSLATRSCRASELARRMPRRGRPTAELVAQRKAAALDQAEAECREHGFHLSQPAGKARKGVKTVAGIARDFEVSKTTIQHRLRGGRSRADEGKERQALDPEEEERIIDYTAQAAQAQFPLAKRHVLQFANKIRRERGHTGPDLSEGWYRNFKKRHRGRLLVRRAKRLAKERNYAVSFGQMQGWWEDVRPPFRIICPRQKLIPTYPACPSLRQEEDPAGRPGVEYGQKGVYGGASAE